MKKDNQLLIEGVQKQLHQIVNGEELKRSPVLAKFLEFVVKATLSGKQEEIKEYTIGVKALGRPADFNPARKRSNFSDSLGVRCIRLPFDE